MMLSGAAEAPSDTTERTETVRDDVRREEVDVQNADRRPA
jgi:hypothetical protein